MRRLTIAAGFLVLGTLGVSAATAANPAEGAEIDRIWADPEFRKAFVGSYGIHPDIEPKLNPEERTLLEKIYPLMSSDSAAAKKELEAAAAKPDSSALFEYILGNMAFQQDQTEEAAARYAAAVEEYPSFRRAWKNLGLTQVRQGKYEDSIRSFTRMIELGGGDAISYGLLGYAFTSKGDFLAAEMAYRNALLLDPQNTDWRLGLARSVVKQEKYEEAAALLHVLIERFPDRPEFWLLQANAYLGMKQPLRAAENLEVVERMGKASPDTLNLLGDLYVNEAKLDLAARAYSRALQADPGQNPARAVRNVEVLAARGGMTEAQGLAANVRSIYYGRLPDEDTQKLLKLEARIAVADGNGGEAVLILEEVVAKNPLDGDALMLLGQHYARSGEPEKALVYFERAGNLEAYEASAKLRQAQVLVGQGKYQEALPLLRRSQEIKPSDDVARYLEQVERLVRTQG
ncbi:MAG: tetratricopeptide repeat protein [Acidobacteria bacterium]|jgi:tetratricopeptide (TPR) repeat protein|nr:tetratricopeptide repeat protein [Acidobacteriota bacterium]